VLLAPALPNAARAGRSLRAGACSRRTARPAPAPADATAVDATRLIRHGQRIRVHGTDGYVEILP